MKVGVIFFQRTIDGDILTSHGSRLFLLNVVPDVLRRVRQEDD
jgi:hypothetical protein